MAYRASCTVAGRTFIINTTALREVYSDGSSVARGTLLTSTGRVGLVGGRTHLFITDGAHGYTLELATNSFLAITDPDFVPGPQASELGGYYISAAADGDQFVVSAADDPTAWDALDFATAEDRPDKIVGHTTLNRELLLFGETSTEWWYLSGDASFPFARRSVTAVGCLARWTIQRVDNAVICLGQDENGRGMVYLFAGYTGRRISNPGLEDYLSTSSDLTAATAYVWQRNGETFYAINAPGLETTPIYQVSIGEWVDMADVSGGAFVPFRAVGHVFAFGRNLMITDAGNLHALSDSIHAYGSTARVCERTGPHNVDAMRNLVRYSEVVADVTTGGASAAGPAHTVALSWSNDKGHSFSTPVDRPIGEQGQRVKAPRWRRLGVANDRVWRLRYEGAGEYTINALEVR